MEQPDDQDCRAKGSTTATLVPPPGGDSTHTLPWWLSTIDFTIASPSPVPLVSVLTFAPR